MALRYLFLTSHYRSQLNFTWKSLKSAQNALNNLTNAVSETRSRSLGKRDKNFFRNKAEILEKRFLEAINDDLNTPKATAILWDVVRHSEIFGREKKELILKFDKVLGLGLKKTKRVTIPVEIKKIAEKREELRKKEKWQEADKIRKKLAKNGWILEDTKEGIKITKTKD